MKNTIEKNIKRYNNIIEKLIESRDDFDEDTLEHKYFQGLIDNIVIIKNTLETEKEKAEIEILKAKLK